MSILSRPFKLTIGIGVDHSPNALITVSPFVEAWIRGVLG